MWLHLVSRLCSDSHHRLIASRSRPVTWLIAIALTWSASGIAFAQASNKTPRAPDQSDSSLNAESTSDQSTVEPKRESEQAEPRDWLESPSATMMSFLEAMGSVSEADAAGRQAAIDRAVETFQLPDDPSTLEVDPDDLTIELYGILNRLIEVADYQLPDKEYADNFNLDSFTYYPRNRNAYYFHGMREWPVRGDRRVYPPFDERFPDGKIELVRTTDDEWKFSVDTVTQIHAFYSAVEDLPIVFGQDERALSFHLRIRSLFPKSLRTGMMLGIEYWQWISLFLVVFLGVVLDFILRFLCKGVVRAIIHRRGASASNDAIQGLVRPLGLLGAGIFWLIVLPLLGLPMTPLKVLRVAVKLITMVAGVWAAFRVADVAGEALASKAAKTDTKFDDLLVPLVRKTVKVFIAAFGLIYIADSLEIEILPLLTGLGIGGAAIAFASKDTVENFFGSIAVIIDRPFEVGDWIVINDVEGTVEALGFRSTRVRTFYNSLITVPNSNLVRAVVDNYGRRKYRRYKTMVSITYDTPPEKIEAMCEGIRELIRLHPYTRKDYFHVWLNAFSASSLDILVYIFFEAPDWGTELRERHRFMLDIIRLTDELGVEFAFPTQTLHMYQQEPVDRSQLPDAKSVRPTEPDLEETSRGLGMRIARRMTKDASWRKGLKPDPVTFDAVALPDPEMDPDSQIEDRTAGG